MTGPFFSVLAGCACMAVLCSVPARAADGRIAFSGTIVEPSCTSSSEGKGLRDAAFAATSRRLACDSTTDIPTGSASSYVLLVAALTGSDSTGDRLLDYFVGYLSPITRNEARLVTRSYE